MSRNNSQALTQRGVSGLTGTKKAGGLTRTGQPTGPRDKHTSSLVLRGGQDGIWGTGEIQLPGQHYSGPQKLAYRANSLVTTGLLPPFQFATLINIAWAQGGFSLYTVEKLFDKNWFFEEMTANLKSRPEVALAKSAGNKQDWLSDKKFVATQVAARIHNLFFIASSWRMIWTLLFHMNEIMDTGAPIRPQLLENERLRKYFLALYDCINEVIQVGRQQVSQLVISSEHFNHYFALIDGNRVAFSPNTEHIREAHKSLLATVMLELALENSNYPIDVLMACLGDVIADAPRAKHRISQGLWDAIGDLSVAVEFRGQLDAALVGGQKDYREWFGNQSGIEGYGRYKDAIEKSAEAAEAAPDEIATLINPLDKTKTATGLLAMWKAVQEVYVACAGTNIEALWMLEGAFDSQPHWQTFFLPELANNSDDDDDDWYERSRAMQKKRKSAPKKNQLAIADRGAYDSDDDDDLPDLLDVSDSSAEEESSSEEEDEKDWEDESDYDDDAQEKLEDLMQEAKKYEFGESKSTPGDVDDNPFIHLLKGLKGRFATLNPRSNPSKSKTAVPDERFMKVKPSAPKPKAASTQAPPKKTPHGPPTSMQPTMEEVEDEEEGGVPQAAKKKKKKKKKKKAAGASAATATESPAPTPVASPASPKPAPAKPASSPTAPAKAASKPAPPKRKPVPNPLVGAFDPFGSQVSLSLGPETAQSARSYLKQAGLTTEPKSKSKSQAETLPTAPPKEKTSMFTRLKRDAMGDMDHEDKDNASSDQKKGVFSGLKKRVKRSLRQILSPTEDVGGRGRKGMKWEEFEKTMVGLKFEIDGSAAGSSVRFSPSNKDRPILFHKPHPDSFIPYNMLIEFSKRLKDQYGWEEDMLEIV